ncbi:MAG TPA: transposase, partial [Gammaproteobacteria bacterium]|nr:transposase [Gammaproteobacteria bacterium]
MLLVHKIELKPNNKQKTYFKKSCGVARFAYNWALAEWKQQYEAGGKPSEVSLRRQLNAIKATEFPWMSEVTKVAPQQAIKNLGSAFNRFFKHQGKYPKFKKKGIRDSFRADNGPAKKGDNAVEIADYSIALPRIGSIRLTEKLRYTGGQIKS